MDKGAFFGTWEEWITDKKNEEDEAVALILNMTQDTKAKKRKEQVIE